MQTVEKRVFTPEHLERKRIAATGKKYPNRRPMSEEQKTKMRASYYRRIAESQGKPIMVGYELISTEVPKTIEVALCTSCSRKYLVKLHCLFCA